MVTLQVYTPPSDVSRGEKVTFVVLDSISPVEFSHSTVGAVNRLAGTENMHIRVRDWPAVKIMESSYTTGGISSAGGGAMITV